MNNYVIACFIVGITLVIGAAMSIVVQVLLGSGKPAGVVLGVGVLLVLGALLAAGGLELRKAVRAGGA